MAVLPVSGLDDDMPISLSLVLQGTNSFREAVDGMNLMLLDSQFEPVLERPFLLQPGSFWEHEPTGDIMITVTDLQVLSCLLHAQQDHLAGLESSHGTHAEDVWNAPSGITYQIRMPAGVGPIILSGSSMQEVAHVTDGHAQARKLGGI